MLKRINLSLINTVYICVMVVYMAIREVLPLNFLIDSNIVSGAIFAVAAVLIIADLLTERKCLKGRVQDILILFLAVCCISSLINIKLGFFDNAKFIATLIIEYLIFFSFAKGDTKEEISKKINCVTATLIITWAIIVFLSVIMYFLSIDITLFGHGTWGKANQGFSTEYSRLWGILQDPNYAGVTSVICAFASLRFIFLNKNTVIRILNGLNIALQTVYIILGNSRATLILYFVAITIFVAYKFILQKENQKPVKTAQNIIITLLTVAVCASAFFGIKAGIPYAKAFFANQNSSVQSLAVSAYSKLYSASGYEFEFVSPDYSEGKNPSSGEIGEDITSQPQQESTTGSEELTTNSEELTTEAESTSEPEGNSDTPDENTTSADPTVDSLDRTDLDKEDISNGRFTRWKQTIEVFLNAPIFGTSPRNLTPFARLNNSDTIIAKFAIVPHNGYLDVLVETGLVGFSVLAAAFILAIFTALKNFFKARFSQNRAFLIISVIILAGIAVFISDIFMLFSINSMLFWTLLGFAYNYGAEPKSKGFFYFAYSKTIGKLTDKIFHKKG